ncbi:hypothetical protein EVAR_2771_1 [Eumeta japonica]|uniref:Uncharacterized protein n=1 Tax=Eumeta variegata TaxID=151549 RepID=A0A4C1T2G2_EUMVA|nr:hypothetical protein EVAR_2771_1 [Eumeta japonica]
MAENPLMSTSHKARKTCEHRHTPSTRRPYALPGNASAVLGPARKLVALSIRLRRPVDLSNINSLYNRYQLRECSVSPPRRPGSVVSKRPATRRAGRGRLFTRQLEMCARYAAGGDSRGGPGVLFSAFRCGGAMTRPIECLQAPDGENRTNYTRPVDGREPKRGASRPPPPPPPPLKIPRRAFISGPCSDLAIALDDLCPDRYRPGARSGPLCVGADGRFTQLALMNDAIVWPTVDRKKKCRRADEWDIIDITLAHRSLINYNVLRY